MGSGRRHDSKGTWSRRRALGALGLGAGALALPFTSLLTKPRAARANDGLPTARRLVVWYAPNGTVQSYRRPLDQMGAFDLSASQVLAPLAPIASDLIFLDGLHIPGGAEHEVGQAKMLTNVGGLQTVSAGRSIDQFVADERAEASTTMFRSLELGVQSNVTGGLDLTRMCYRSPTETVAPDDDPSSVFARMFSGVSLDGEEDPSQAKLRARRLAVLDTVERDALRLRERLATEERNKLDVHVQSLHDLAKTLEATGVGGPGCAVLDQPPAMDLFDHANIPTIGKLQTDLLVMALACNMTQVASLQWTFTRNPHVFSWLGHSEGLHDLSHAADADPVRLGQFIDSERWYAEQFRYFIERLAATPDPDGEGSLLDTTLVVWPKEQGDSRLHEDFDVSWVLAGSAGGRFATGKYHRFDDLDHAHVLISICQAMGLNNETFGAPNAKGPIEELLA